MVRRSGDGRAFRKRAIDLKARLDLLEERIARLERAVGTKEPADAEQCSGCDDLIGCLDDCVTDVRELRKKVRDVRS